MTDDDLPLWERPEMVERFAGREPDHRLKAIVPEYADPGSTRVLDVGCAGGRNTVYLARLGFDVAAVDSSKAMVAETRRRVAEVVGRPQADMRVRHGPMTDLSSVPAGSVDLVIALGVLHEARSRREWDAALAEIRRVIGPGGRLLVSNHTDEFQKAGATFPPVPGEPGVFLRGDRRAFLLSADALDREMGALGFTPVVPTETKRVPNEDGGLRVTANGFYVKAN